MTRRCTLYVILSLVTTLQAEFSSLEALTGFCLTSVRLPFCWDRPAPCCVPPPFLLVPFPCFALVVFSLGFALHVLPPVPWQWPLSCDDDVSELHFSISGDRQLWHTTLPSSPLCHSTLDTTLHLIHTGSDIYNLRPPPRWDYCAYELTLCTRMLSGSFARAVVRGTRNSFTVSCLRSYSHSSADGPNRWKRWCQTVLSNSFKPAVATTMSLSLVSKSQELKDAGAVAFL